MPMAAGTAVVTAVATSGAAALSKAEVGMRKAGRNSESNGSIRTAAAAAVHTRCRVAAELRRSSFVISRAPANTTVLFSANPTQSANHILSALLFRVLDQFGHAIQLFVCEARG